MIGNSRLPFQDRGLNHGAKACAEGANIDRTDYGGVVNRKDPRQPGNDLVMRVYDAARRRQPPRAAENKAKPEGKQSNIGSQ